MPHNPYRITVTGLITSAAAGVYLATVPLGLVAMVAVASTKPVTLSIVPAYVALGAAAGLLAARLMRTPATERPKLRRRRFAIVGASTLPFVAFVGQLDLVIPDTTAGSRIGAFIFFCGAGGVVTYYVRRRNVVRGRWRREAAASRPVNQPPVVAHR